MKTALYVLGALLAVSRLTDFGVAATTLTNSDPSLIAKIGGAPEPLSIDHFLEGNWTTEAHGRLTCSLPSLRWITPADDAGRRRWYGACG